MPPGDETAAPAGAEHSTLYVAIVISRKSWVVGIKGPSGPRIGLHTLAAADVAALGRLIEAGRAGAERALGRAVRVLCCYEAGYEGFWLARWLDRALSVETVVLDPASLLVNRKAKQRKTDRIDAKKMVRALLAHDRGDAAVLSRVRVPSVDEEDRKRLLRERRRLVKERTALTNAIGGVLKLHGIFGLRPRARHVQGGSRHGSPKRRQRMARRCRRGPGVRSNGWPSGWRWSTGRSPRSRPSATRLSAEAKPCRRRMPARTAKPAPRCGSQP